MAQEEWGSSPQDFMGEPRKIYIALLIYNIKVIQAELFGGGRASKAVQRLRGLILALDPESKDKLKAEFKKLQEWDGGKSYYRTDVEEVFDKTCDLLHEVYLQEFRRPRLDKQHLDALEEKDSDKS